PLPEETFKLAQASDAILLGAVGGPKWDGLAYEVRPERALLGLRERLGLYANLRPAKLYSMLADASTLKPEVIIGADLLVVRELTGGIYFGKPKGIEKTADGERGVNTEVYTTAEIVRIAKVAFESARERREPRRRRRPGRNVRADPRERARHRRPGPRQPDRHHRFGGYDAELLVQPGQGGGGHRAGDRPGARAGLPDEGHSVAGHQGGRHEGDGAAHLSGAHQSLTTHDQHRSRHHHHHRRHRRAGLFRRRRPGAESPPPRAEEHDHRRP